MIPESGCAVSGAVESPIPFLLHLDWPVYSHSLSNKNTMTSFPVLVCGLGSQSMSECGT